MHRDTGTQIGQSTDFDRCPSNDHVQPTNCPTDDHDQPARRYDHNHDNQHRPTDDHDNFAGSARLAG